MNFLFPYESKNSKLRRRWKKIEKKIDKADSEPEWKIYVLEAGDIVKKYLPKEDVDELTRDDIVDLGEFLEAYQTVRTIKEDLTYKLEKKEAKDILDIFKNALISLDVMS